MLSSSFLCIAVWSVSEIIWCENGIFCRVMQSLGQRAGDESLICACAYNNTFMKSECFHLMYLVWWKCLLFPRLWSHWYWVFWQRVRRRPKWTVEILYSMVCCCCPLSTHWLPLRTSASWSILVLSILFLPYSYLFPFLLWWEVEQNCRVL